MSFNDSHVGASLGEPWTQWPHRFFLVLRSPILMCTSVPLNFQATSVMGRTKGSGTKQNNKKANNAFCLPSHSASPAASSQQRILPTQSFCIPRSLTLCGSESHFFSPSAVPHVSSSGRYILTRAEEKKEDVFFGLQNKGDKFKQLRCLHGSSEWEELENSLKWAADDVCLSCSGVSDSETP